MLLYLMHFRCLIRLLNKAELFRQSLSASARESGGGVGGGRKARRGEAVLLTFQSHIRQVAACSSCMWL
jgi:hypothetical protein